MWTIEIKVNRWLKAFWYDLIGQEDKSPLDTEEKHAYTLALGGICTILSFLGFLFWWPVGLVFGLIAARKYQIWLHKKGIL